MGKSKFTSAWTKAQERRRVMLWARRMKEKTPAQIQARLKRLQNYFDEGLCREADLEDQRDEQQKGITGPRKKFPVGLVKPLGQRLARRRRANELLFNEIRKLRKLLEKLGSA